MAGRGPAPKSPERRVRRNKSGPELTIVQVMPDGQPSLFDEAGEDNPAIIEQMRMQAILLETKMPEPGAVGWHPAAVKFWHQLGEFPTTRNLLSAQWSLLIPAIIAFDLVMRGDTKMMSEMRLQLAKFGIAPDDVARLRYQLVLAEEGERRLGTRGGSGAGSARERARGRAISRADLTPSSDDNPEAEVPVTPAKRAPARKAAPAKRAPARKAVPAKKAATARSRSAKGA